MATSILHVLSDLDPGGAQFVVLDIVRHLDRARFLPRVCCLRAGGELEREFEAIGVPVHVIPFASRFSLTGLIRLRRMIRRERVALVHTHLRRANHVGRLGAVLADAPVIVAHHHDTIAETKRRQKLMTRWLAARSDLVLCVSEEVRRARLEAGDEPATLLRVLHNFVDPAACRDAGSVAEARRALALPESPAVACIGLVGRLHPLKNHAFFLQTARHLLDRGHALHFAVVGGGALEDELERQAEALRLGDALTFTGPRRDMARVYRALDTVVLCSEREGFPKVLLEAQAAGKPVVTLPLGGVDEVLSGGGGIVVDDPSPEAFGAGILASLEPTARARLVEEAAANVARFAPHTIMRKLQRIYTELCGKKGIA